MNKWIKWEIWFSIFFFSANLLWLKIKSIIWILSSSFVGLSWISFWNSIFTNAYEIKLSFGIRIHRHTNMPLLILRHSYFKCDALHNNCGRTQKKEECQRQTQVSTHAFIPVTFQLKCLNELSRYDEVGMLFPHLIPELFIRITLFQLKL